MSDRKTRSLASVLEIATHAFAARRYEDVRVSDIARAARCSASTIYDAYGDKSSLFVQAARNVLVEAFEPVCRSVADEAGLGGVLGVLERFGVFLQSGEVRGVFRAVIGAPVETRASFAELHLARRQRMFETLGARYADALEAGHASEARVSFVVEHAVAVVNQRIMLLPLLLGGSFDEVDARGAVGSSIEPFLTPAGLLVLERWTSGRPELSPAAA